MSDGGEFRKKSRLSVSVFFLPINIFLSFYKNKTSGSKKIENKCKGEEKKEGVDPDSKESIARRRRDRRRRIVIAQKEGTLK